MSKNQSTAYPRPDWINAPEFDSVDLSYGSDDVRIGGDDQTMRVWIGRGSEQFVVVFGSFFTLLVGVAIFWFSQDWELKKRVVVSFLAMCHGVLLFSLMHWHFRRHREKGDYLLICRTANTIELPRIGKKFSLNDIVGLQRIAGRSNHDENMIGSDLNLLVKAGDEVLRYHIMGDPRDEHLRRIAEFSGIDVQRINVRRGERRETDKNSARD
ncbi:MAG: hypothetical protein AAF663_13345 [Planctomycetota bacterium]